jgi:hypothetical protein
MRRLLPFLLALFLVSPIVIGGHAFAQDDDDSAAMVADDDDSAPADAAAAIPDVEAEEALVAVKTLLDYQKSGWGALVAALLTLFIFLVRKAGLLAKVPKKALPWVAAAVAMVGDVAAALTSGAPVADAMLQGLMLGAAAVGFWEMALKHALKPSKETDDEDDET